MRWKILPCAIAGNRPPRLLRPQRPSSRSHRPATARPRRAGRGTGGLWPRSLWQAGQGVRCRTGQKSPEHPSAGQDDGCASRQGRARRCKPRSSPGGQCWPGRLVTKPIEGPAQAPRRFVLAQPQGHTGPAMADHRRCLRFDTSSSGARAHQRTIGHVIRPCLPPAGTAGFIDGKWECPTMAAPWTQSFGGAATLAAGAGRGRRHAVAAGAGASKAVAGRSAQGPS